MTTSEHHRTLQGRYRLQREIARGGMAAVWEAHDSLLDRKVAIKLLHAEELSSDTARRSAASEPA